MTQKYIPRIIVSILGVLIVLGAVNAVAASNTVPTTHLQQISTPLGIIDKLPADCKGMPITAILTCPTDGSDCVGTSSSELILGSVNDDLIRGKGGRDCILGGAGNDDLRGGGAGDVCIGGDGVDAFNAGCEVRIQ